MTTPAISQAQMRLFLKQQPAFKRGLATMARIEGSDHYLAHITVIQDLAISLLPKLFLARSRTEIGEATFLEFFENVLVYYSIPFLGTRVFKPLVKKLLPEVDAALLQKPLANIPKELHGKMLPAKAALIIGALGMAVGAEFAIAYLKPLLTAQVTGKTEFSDVIGLKKHHIHRHEGEENPQFVHSMARRLLGSLLAVGAMFAASVAMMRFGHKAPKLQKPLESFVNNLDFDYTNGKMALNLPQIATYMSAAVVAYLTSCRDKLEKVEVATRLAIIMPYLLFFRQFMSGKLNQRLAKTVPEAFIQQGNRLSAKPLEAIYQEGLEKARQLHPHLDEQALQPYIKQMTQKALDTRLKAFAIPLVTGITGAGIGVGLLNRFWTKYRFEHRKSGNSSPALPPTLNLGPLPPQGSVFPSQSVSASAQPFTLPRPLQPLVSESAISS